MRASRAGLLGVRLDPSRRRRSARLLRIRCRRHTPATAQCHPEGITCSVGAAQWQPGESVSMLLSHADAAHDRVHRRIGVTENVVGGGAALGQGDADAVANGDFGPLQVDRLAKGGSDPFGQPGRGGQVDVFEQQRELVATEPGHRVGAAHSRLQTPSHLLEQLVPGTVPESVVDLLEVVEVHEQHRAATAGAGSQGQGVLEAVKEQPAIGQPGERVVERQTLDLLLQRRALGHVVASAEDGAQRPLRTGACQEVRSLVEEPLRPPDSTDLVVQWAVTALPTPPSGRHFSDHDEGSTAVRGGHVGQARA